MRVLGIQKKGGNWEKYFMRAFHGFNETKARYFEKNENEECNFSLIRTTWKEKYREDKESGKNGRAYL